MIHDKINDKRKALGRGLESLLPSRPTISPIAMPAAQSAIDRYLSDGRRKLRRDVRAFIRWLRGPGRTWMVSVVGVSARTVTRVSATIPPPSGAGTTTRYCPGSSGIEN